MNEVTNQVKEKIQLIKVRCAEKFLDLLGASVIISGTLSIMLVGTCCYMWGNEIMVPPELLVVLSSVIAFFFGARTQANALKARGK